MEDGTLIANRRSRRVDMTQPRFITASPGETTIPRSDISSNKRAAYVTRKALLEILSDEEVARVSTTEASPRLANDEEYIDLLQLSEGVRKVSASSKLTMGHARAELRRQGNLDEDLFAPHKHPGVS